MASPIYEFQLSVYYQAEGKKGGRESKSFFIDNITKFAILGGAKRTIRNDGSNGIGDAELMAEFYQAKQFHNLILTKDLDLETFTLYKIYEKQIPFEFSFAVRSLNVDSRFRFLQLKSKTARIIKPPSTEDQGETLNIKYSSPEVFYLYAYDKGLKSEKL
jgi:hypothetical protein